MTSRFVYQPDETLIFSEKKNKNIVFRFTTHDSGTVSPDTRKP